MLVRLGILQVMLASVMDHAAPALDRAHVMDIRPALRDRIGTRREAAGRGGAVASRPPCDGMPAALNLTSSRCVERRPHVGHWKTLKAVRGPREIVAASLRSSG